MAKELKAEKFKTKDEILSDGLSELLKQNYNLNNCTNCENCFGMTDCVDCSHSMHMLRCERCFMCSACTDCIDCVFSHGLSGKQFVVCDVQLTEEEYNQFKIK